MTLKRTQFTLPSEKRFLLDAFGAFLTALLLGVILPAFQPFFGMPVTVLYCLAGIAAVFCLYSLGCHFRAGDQWRPLLRAIALANLAYCCLTMGLVVYWWEQLTALGVLYFVGEAGIVLGLAGMELAMVARPAGEGERTPVDGAARLAFENLPGW